MPFDPFIRLQHLAPQHGISRFAGRVARSERPWLRDRLIRRFAAAYGVNMDEAERPITDYSSFNDFFTRSLKPGARPLADAQRHVLSPADGAISQMGRIEKGRIVQAKGQSYTAAELLGGDEELARRFDGGNFITIYLSPTDYHRVHMPLAGTLRHTTYIPGDLFSVNHATAQGVERLFARNERLSCMFDTDHGMMASVMVGAMIVASIETVWGGPVAPHGRDVIQTDYPQGEGPAPQLAAGAEMGRFLLGSTVILLFEPDRMAFEPGLAPLDTVRMGQSIGSFRSNALA